MAPQGRSGRARRWVGFLNKAQKHVIGASGAPESASTLGMLLIDSFAKQLKGTLRFENSGGLVCDIPFPAGASAV